MWPALGTLLAPLTLVHTLWELSKHNPLTCTLTSSFEWDWWAFSALHWVASSCGTRWKLWAGRDLVTLGVCRHLDGLVIGGSLSRVSDCLWLWSVACEGFLTFPRQRAKRYSIGLLVSLSYLTCGRFLWHQVWARCVIPISRRTTNCWSTQQRLACWQAREPWEKNHVSLVSLDISWCSLVFILIDWVLVSDGIITLPPFLALLCFILVVEVVV